MSEQPRWIQIATTFFEAALDGSPATNELMAALRESGARTWAQLSETFPRLTHGMTAPVCEAVSVRAYANHLLDAWGETLDEAFLVAARAEGTEDATRRALEAEQAESVANSSAGPIALLAEWAVSPYELTLPLADGGRLPFRWKAIQAVAEDLDVPINRVVDYAVLEAAAIYVCVERPTVARQINKVWLEFLAAQDVDVDQLLGRAWKINPNRTSWSDGIIIVDGDAMIAAFRGPEQLVPAAQLAQISAVIIRAADQVIDRVTGPEATEDSASVRDHLMGRRSAPGDFDYYLRACYGLTVNRHLSTGASSFQHDKRNSEQCDADIANALDQL